jgi:uncharacterized membrane protein (UPF0127 family)
MHQTTLDNLTHPLKEPISVGICDTFLSRLRGFMFQRGVSVKEGLVIIQPGESRLDAAIHMFFVNFDLAVIWLDRNDIVVDKCLARRWRPFYMPARRAMKILEIHPNRLDEFVTGDQVSLKHV